MKKYSGMALFILVALQLIAGCSGDNENARSMEQIYREDGVPVKVDIISHRPYAVESRYNAVLTGIRESNASAMIGDKVDKIYFTVGAHVNKDDVIISFPTNNPAAQYYQSKVAFEHAQTTFSRMENLYKSGGISLQEFENTRTQYRVAKANWDAVQQSVLVRAPISGTITSINVQESDNVHPGDALFTISQTEKLKTRLWLTENERRDIHPGDRAEALWNDATIQGSVTQVDLSLNSQNQAFGATVEFDNPGNSVISGVNAEITIFSDTKTDACIVERKNVIQKGDSYYVFTVKNQHAVLKPIVIGNDFGLDLEVASGLSEGDSLITEGQLMLEDGDLINIITGAE